jgi:isopentenyldiphosphate isomerase
MKEEPVDILDEDANRTGQVMLKSEAHTKSLRHSGAHLWIYNSKGEVLLQLRHPTKVIRPNVWDVSVAGHITAGHDPRETIVREAKEELNLDIDTSKLTYIGTQKVDEPVPQGWTHRVFNWTYITQMDINIKDLKLEKSEVADIKWLPIDEFEDELRDPEKSKKYTPTRLEFYAEVIDQIRKDKRPGKK